jgi:hypothetical protein
VGTLQDAVRFRFSFAAIVPKAPDVPRAMQGQSGSAQLEGFCTRWKS